MPFLAYSQSHVTDKFAGSIVSTDKLAGSIVSTLEILVETKVHMYDVKYKDDINAHALPEKNLVKED